MRRVPEIVLGALIATAFWSAVLLWQSQKPVPHNETSPAKTEQQHAVTGGPASQQEQHSKGHQKGKWYDTFLNHTPDWFVAIFTALLTFVTYRLVSSTNKLWEAGERQIELARETASAQSRDMQASIKAAVAANKVAENALIANDGAWVSIKADIIAPLVFEKERIHIGVGFDLTNIGRSPATHLEVHAKLCFDIIDAKHQGDDAAKRSPYAVMDFGIVLFPNDTWERDALEMEMPIEIFRQKISKAQERARKDGDPVEDWSTSHPAVMVCARYRLAGSNKPRHTIICYEVRRAKSPEVGWDGSEGTTDLVYLNLVQTFMSGQVT